MEECILLTWCGKHFDLALLIGLERQPCVLLAGRAQLVLCVWTVNGERDHTLTHELTMKCPYRNVHIAMTALKSPHEHLIISSLKIKTWTWNGLRGTDTDKHQQESRDVQTTCNICLHSMHKLNVKVVYQLYMWDQSVQHGWTLFLCTITMFIACLWLIGWIFARRNLDLFENVNKSMQKTGKFWFFMLDMNPEYLATNNIFNEIRIYIFNH